MTCQADAKTRLDRLMREYLKIPAETLLESNTRIASLGVADWRVIDLGIAVAVEFNVELTADRALALESVGDWHRLISG